MSQERFREAEVRSLCRRETAEAEAMHLHGETLKNLTAGRMQRNRLTGMAMPLQNLDSGQQRAFLLQF